MVDESHLTISEMQRHEFNVDKASPCADTETEEAALGMVEMLFTAPAIKDQEPVPMAKKTKMSQSPLRKLGKRKIKLTRRMSDSGTSAHLVSHDREFEVMEEPCKRTRKGA